MAPHHERLVFLADEDVPRSGSTFLQQSGYEIHMVTRSTYEGELDEVIARLAHLLSREIGSHIIVLTFNHRHFRTHISRRPPNNNLRFRNVGRLSFTCDRSIAVKRLRETLDDVEREYALCQQRADKRRVRN